jgi:lipoprotein-releasing system permease protein
MGFSTRAALRLIFSKKKKTFINFLSYISIIALSIGTASMIIILSVYNGLENTLKSVYQDFDPEIKIEKVDSKYFENKYSNIIKGIENVKEVSAIIENKVVVQNEKKEVVTYLKGVDDNFKRLNKVSDKLTEGEFVFKMDNIDYCVIGRGIKYSLGIRTNSNFQSIKVFSLNEGKKLSPSLMQQNIYNQDFLKTSGVFAIESGFDNNYIFTSLDFAQNLFNKKELISSYEIIVKNKENINVTKNEIKKTIGPEFVVLTDIEQRAGLYKILQTEKLVVYFVFLIVLFLSAINIFFLLIMMGVEKRKDISVMFSFGAKRHQVRNIFINQGLIIGFTSVIIGFFLGVCLTLLQQKFGLIQIQMTSSILTAYPVSLMLEDLLIVASMVMFVSLIASFFPGIILTTRNNFNNIKNAFV